MERNSISALHGQVTIGTLILQVFIFFVSTSVKRTSLVLRQYEVLSWQDCAVGLLFALLPVLGGSSGVLQGVLSMTKS